jgi:hypothetical protein
MADTMHPVTIATSLLQHGIDVQSDAVLLKQLLESVAWLASCSCDQHSM